MTQIETIIAEIERRIEQFKEERSKVPPTTPKSVDRLSLGARIAALEETLVFINSLPAAEQPSEELNKEIDRFIADNIGKTITVGQVAHYFAKWQKEQLMKSATNGCYITRNKYTKQNVLNGLSVTCEAIQKFRDGDKVKVIIIKEDEQ